jgi:hypothetical protein
MAGHRWRQKMVAEDTVPRHLISSEVRTILCKRSQVCGARAALGAACCSLVLAIFVSGCSSNSNSNSNSSSSSGSEQTTALKPGTPVSFDLAHNARADVRTETCKESSGAWVLKGTVTNPGTAATGFQIVVDFVEKGDTVLSTTEVNIAYVAPKSSASWSATGARGKSGVSCIVRLAQTI